MRRLRAAALTAAALFGCIAASAITVRNACAESGEFLPDSTVLARVGDRTIRVHDLRDRYFSSDATTRPGSDSLGRATFLATMIDKEVMGLTALAIQRPLEPNDQRVMRQHEANLLAFVAYKRFVRDSIVVTEREVRDLYDEQSWDLRLRYLLLPDQKTAEAVRSQLVGGRITWRDAATRHSLAPDSLRERDLGWLRRADLPGPALAQLFKLRPPGISGVILDEEGYKIWQCIGRRPAENRPAYRALRKALALDLHSQREARFAVQLIEELSRRAKPQYDTTNIVWMAERFRYANRGIGTSDPSSVDMRSRVPVISSADTSRVLATAGATKVTVGRLIVTYRDAPAVTRPRIQTPAAVFQFAQRMVLEPTVIVYARERHIDRDPEYLAELAKKREGILVQHLYEDSVQTRIAVTEAMRRQFYDANPRSFMTRERVRYALIVRTTEAGADSVIALLKSGETPQAILARDSLTGMTRGSIREVAEGQPHVFQALLFGELREGQSAKEYLDIDKVWVVFHVITHEMPRPQSYAEAREIVDQSVENLAAEQLLDDLLARLRKRYRIESHPELLPRVQLTDPHDEWNVTPDS